VNDTDWYMTHGGKPRNYRLPGGRHLVVGQDWQLTVSQEKCEVVASKFGSDWVGASPMERVVILGDTADAILAADAADALATVVALTREYLADIGVRL